MLRDPARVVQEGPVRVEAGSAEKSSERSVGKNADRNVERSADRSGNRSGDGRAKRVPGNPKWARSIACFL